MEIKILCPSKGKSGGPECLHQFGAALVAAGAKASMVYYPDQDGGTSEFFEQYGVPIAESSDAAGDIVVVPEVATYLVRDFPLSTTVVYWLSVDNYLQRDHKSILRDTVRRWRSLMTLRVPLRGLRSSLHLSQSVYSERFLARAGVPSFFIGDYLNDAFFEEADEAAKRGDEAKNQVCYNPAKGGQYVELLRDENPSIPFVPIVGMSRAEVVATLASSKMYLDLGHHPGKDRIPREAAVLGCCVATSRRGAAGNRADVPIPEDYKFGTSRAELRRIPQLIARVFENFEAEKAVFDSYRQLVRREKDDFVAAARAWVRILEKRRDLKASNQSLGHA
jgi:hypothetical protein